MQKFEELSALVDAAKSEAEKFYGKSNAAAGTRVRKIMQQIKVVCSDIRNDVTEVKKSGKDD